MRAFVLPDEEAWVLPEPWRQAVIPRRGGLPGPQRPAPPDPVGQLRDWLAAAGTREHLAHLQADHPGLHDPLLLAEGDRYLRAWLEPDAPDDQATPLGAAVALLLTPDAARYNHRRGRAAFIVDAWVARSGLEFAARVAGELAGLICRPDLRPWGRPLDEARAQQYETLWPQHDLEKLHGVVSAVRPYLAATTDPEYERICQILDGYRTSPVGRITTSYLVPTQVAWVDEDCAAAAGWPEAWRGMLLLAASSVRQLELLSDAVSGFFSSYECDEMVGTVLDGVGPAAAPVLVNPIYRELLRLHDDKWRYRHRVGVKGLRLLAATPTDAAFRLLCEMTVTEEAVRPALLLKSGVLSRYPVRALRILTELETTRPSLYTDLLGTHVLAGPALLAAAAEHLPAPVRARVDEIVASGGAGIGVAWTDLLDRHDRRRYLHLIDSADAEKRAVAALAAVPTDEAFGYLVDRIDRTYVRPALLTAARRDPHRALRVLLAKASAATPDATATGAAAPDVAAPDVVAELLRNHVLAHPEAVAAALPTLEPPMRAQVEAIVGSVPAPAGPGGPGAPGGSGSLPPLLAGPPRGPNGKPMRVPDLPEWLVMPALPPVVLRDGGRALPPEAVRQLCALLAVSKIAAAHPSIAEVRTLCEPRSLASFAWAVFEQWQAAQYPSKNAFAMVAVAVFGDDTTVPALTALFPSWAKGSSVRVRTGMDVLAAIGTDVALMYLQRLAHKAKTKGFRRLAEERMVRVAEARGLSRQQLADRIVPDLGLDADGRMTLDYGPRQFTVGFDEQIKPWFADQHGARFARLPRPVAADDQALAPDAYRRFTEIKKEVQRITKERIRALEEAMAMRRHWTCAEFQRLLVQHPLMWQLTRRLLWVVFDEHGAAMVTFRVAEDRTFADVDDKPVSVDATATVGVAHPGHFAPDRAAWTALFTDYEILQPFHQLDRELFTLPEAGTDSPHLASFAGASVEGRGLYALTARGWRFNTRHDAVLRDWPGDRTVEIEFSPGYSYQEPELAERLTAVRVLTTSVQPDGSACSCHPRTDDPARFTDLDPIARSETLRDLHLLTT
jgi:hypothetical protein